jgi:hypothetical protein
MTSVPSDTGVPPAAEPEVCSIEARGPEGELIRKVTQSKAQELVQHGLGESLRAANGRRYVSLYESYGGGRSRSWLRRNDGTTTRERIWEDGKAISAPIISKHLNARY